MESREVCCEETGSLDSLIGSAPVPALIEFAGTQAENFLLASGIQDAIAGLQPAAEAGSYEEVVDILGYTARAIIKSRPLVRAFLCAPVALAYDFATDQLDEYAAAHKWNFFEIEAMHKGLDYGKGALAGACGAFVALGGK